MRVPGQGTANGLLLDHLIKMSINRSLVVSCLAVLVLAMPGLSIAEDKNLDSLPRSLKACLDEEDDALRLECYDREVPRWGSIPADEIVRQQQEEEFGQPPLEALQKETLSEITAKVTRIQKHSGKATIWLDNDQVWQQKYSKSFLIREGDEVLIERGSVLGGHKLEVRGRRIDVKRVK